MSKREVSWQLFMEGVEEEEDKSLERLSLGAVSERATNFLLKKFGFLSRCLKSKSFIRSS